MAGQEHPIHQNSRDHVVLIELLDHLTHAYDDARSYAAAEDLAEHRRDFNSVAMEIIQSQECAHRLSDAAVRDAPELPWNVLRAMRNVIVHEYGDIDYETHYDTAMHDIPGFITQVRALVDRQ